MFCSRWSPRASSKGKRTTERNPPPCYIKTNESVARVVFLRRRACSTSTQTLSPRGFSLCSAFGLGTQHRYQIESEGIGGRWSQWAGQRKGGGRTNSSELTNCGIKAEQRISCTARSGHKEEKEWSNQSPWSYPTFWNHSHHMHALVC